VSLGSVLLLAAIGLAITFGVMGVINMAHGEMVMLGAYTTFVVQEAFRTFAPGWLDYSLPLALPLAFLVTALVGVAIERGVIRFLYGRPLETLLATWGVSLILQQAVRTTFGPTNREVSAPTYMSGSFDFMGLAITWGRLWIIVFTLVLFLALLAAIKLTRLGLYMRAVTQNRRMAAAMGIRTPWIDAITFGLGQALPALQAWRCRRSTTSPNLGQSYIIDSFMVVVFGGVGNLWGTLVGAMTLGVANKFLEPFAGAVLAKITILSCSSCSFKSVRAGCSRCVAGRLKHDHEISLLASRRGDDLSDRFGARCDPCTDVQPALAGDLALPCAGISGRTDGQISVLCDARHRARSGLGLLRHSLARPWRILCARRLCDGHVPDAPDRFARCLRQSGSAGFHGVPELEGTAMVLVRI
jgi:urea ABC transporter permease protein UrtB